SMSRPVPTLGDPVDDAAADAAADAAPTGDLAPVENIVSGGSEADLADIPDEEDPGVAAATSTATTGLPVDDDDAATLLPDDDDDGDATLLDDDDVDEAASRDVDALPPPVRAAGPP